MQQEGYCDLTHPGLNPYFRCLLNAKAAKVMKIIRDMFGLILQFRSLLVAADWTRDKISAEMSHANFNQMLKCFQNFRQYSVFLFKGLLKLQYSVFLFKGLLSVTGYFPYLFSAINMF